MPILVFFCLGLTGTFLDFMGVVALVGNGLRGRGEEHPRDVFLGFVLLANFGLGGGVVFSL